MDTCGHSPYVTSSLTIGWVCRLKLLLALAWAVILGFKSRGLHDDILLSQIRDPQPAGPGPSIYIPQEYGGPVIPPGTGIHFHRLLRLAGLRWNYSSPLPHDYITKSSLYRLGTGHTENIFSFIASFLVAVETCPQSCSLATVVVLLLVYTAVTWQWVYTSVTPSHMLTITKFSVNVRKYFPRSVPSTRAHTWTGFYVRRLTSVKIFVLQFRNGFSNSKDDAVGNIERISTRR
jgi:hypothetical protein